MEFIKTIEDAEVEYVRDYGEGRHGYRLNFFGGSISFSSRLEQWPVAGRHTVTVKCRVYAPGKCAFDVDPVVQE